MYRFVRAGVLAAGLQTALVATVALLVLLQGGIQPGVSSSDPFATTALAADRRTALALTDVLMAVCVSMLRTQAVTGSAYHLSEGFRHLVPRNPEWAAAALISQLLLASIGFAALALRPPPDWFLSLTAPLIDSGSGFVFWSGLLSVGTAAFGANTHAAILGGPG